MWWLLHFFNGLKLVAKEKERTVKKMMVAGWDTGGNRPVCLEGVESVQREEKRRGE